MADLTFAPFLSTGWTNDPYTWTRTANNVFTLAVDATTWLYPGVRIRLKTGGAFQYGVIDTAVFSAGTTTVTCFLTTDYTFAAATVTEQAYSYMPNPQGWPGWFNYTPTITGYSANPTNVAYRWMTVGRTCFLNIAEGTNGTSNATTKTYSLPNAAARTVTNQIWRGTAQVVDAGATTLTATACQVTSGATTMGVFNSWTGAVGWTASLGARVSVASLFYEF